MGTTKAEIGARIKQALDTSGKKQKHLAVALGITEASVSSYMKGNSLPTAAGFAVLSKLTKTSIDWIITGETTTTTNQDPWKNEQPDYCREGPAEWNGIGSSERLILEVIKKGDPELIHELADVILKRRAKPEGCNNGMEGQSSNNA